MEVDWIIHFIPCTPQPSFHTHGLDRHNSLELELNLSLKPKQAMQFIPHSSQYRPPPDWRRPVGQDGICRYTR